MKKAAAEENESRSTRLIERIVHWPRFTRIVLAAVFALALTLAVTPIVDGIYISNFYNNDTRVAPSLVSTALGVVFYIVGWRLMIGYAGETPASRKTVLWYFGIGAAACAVVVILVVIGAISGTLE